MSYCTQCGTPIQPGSAFCTACGAAVASASPTPVTPTPVTPGPVTPQAWSTPAANPANAAPAFTPVPSAPVKSSGRSLVITIAAILLLVVLAGAGGLVYAGYKVKQKATALLHSPSQSTNGTHGPAGSPGSPAFPEAAPGGSSNHSPDGVDQGLDAISGIMDKLGFGDPPPDPYVDLEVVKASDPVVSKCPPVDASIAIKTTAGQIPLRENLMVTSTWGRKFGDVDSLTKVSSVKPDAIEFRNSGKYFRDDKDDKGHDGSGTRDVCAADLQSAPGYQTGYSEPYPLVSPGTTSELLSAAAFQQLKTIGKLSHRYLVLIKTPDGGAYRRHWQEGELARVESADIPYSVIVNDSITSLPVIHVRGLLLPTDKKAAKAAGSVIDKPVALDMKVLDDPLNPLVLFYKFEEDPFRIEVTKISFPNQQKKIEQDLSQNRKAVVYGIYFDFNSDKIKPESKQVLDEIAAAMKDNPDWKLTVDGHTDNIGGDTYNLDLSRRRSLAVKQALVTQYNIAPDRLASSGSGAAGAIDTNDTILGRSHNRRVELTRN